MKRSRAGAAGSETEGSTEAAEGDGQPKDDIPF
jgi:hypothetical protein